MKRNFFLALGIFIVLLGVQFLYIDELTVQLPKQIAKNLAAKTFEMEDYFPYSTMSVGLVFIVLGLRMPKT